MTEMQAPQIQTINKPLSSSPSKHIVPESTCDHPYGCNYHAKNILTHLHPLCCHPKVQYVCLQS